MGSGAARAKQCAGSVAPRAVAAGACESAARGRARVRAPPCPLVCALEPSQGLRALQAGHLACVGAGAGLDAVPSAVEGNPTPRNSYSECSRLSFYIVQVQYSILYSTVTKPRCRIASWRCILKGILLQYPVWESV